MAPLDWLPDNTGAIALALMAGEGPLAAELEPVPRRLPTARFFESESGRVSQR